MGTLRPWHIAVLVVVLILLFGAKRLPDAARGLGRSLRILKAETRGLADDDVAGKAEAQSGRQPLPGGTEQASAQPAADPVQRTRDN
ncbi:MAG TPA: Sec-independent protein translocase subunit TatA [Micromonosporaceae bacterium]